MKWLRALHIVAAFAFSGAVCASGYASASAHDAAGSVTSSMSATAANAATPAPSAIPFKRAAASGDFDWSRLGIGLLVTGLALAGSVYAVRRSITARGPGNRSGKADGRAPAQLVQVIESRRLGLRSTLHVVEFHDAHYLLAQSEHGITCIASAPARQRPGAESI